MTDIYPATRGKKYAGTSSAETQLQEPYPSVYMEYICLPLPESGSATKIIMQAL